MDDPRVARMKHDALWREYRLELRERAERARELRELRRHRGRPCAAGRHVRPELPDEDALAGRPPVGRPASASLAAIQSTPANVLVNDRSLDGSAAAQSEESVVMVGSNGVAAWNNGQGFYSNIDSQGFAWTASGGATWTNVSIPHPPGVQTWYWFSDPVVSVNEKNGEYFYCGLTMPSASTNGISVARGHFSGGSFTWDGVTPVRVGSNSSIFFDKQWMAADSATGNLYLSYTVFSPVGDTIVFQRSTDNGIHWDDPIRVNTSGFGWVSGSRPAVGPSGEVYVVWQEVNNAPNTAYDFMRYRRSTNGGVSFGSQSTAATEYTNFGSGAPGFNRERGITFPSIAVDRSTGPHRGRVSVIWNESLNFYDDAIPTTPRRAEVENDNFFSRATPFTIGEDLEGSLSRLDLDHWSFPATQGTSYIFYLDSLGGSLNYTLRVFCGADTATRLAYSGDPDSTQSSGGTAVIVWTAPTTAPYYVRMAQTAGTGGYRIRTAVAAHGSEPGRDQRDIVMTTSDDGTTWSTPARVNDDSPWFDDWLPEVGVSREGYTYAMWFDWRNAVATCGGSSNIFATRSTDGGAVWAPSLAVTDTMTNWTFTPSNIAPNQGDYSAISCADGATYAWADGRRGNPDVFSAHLSLLATTSCPPDSTWGPGSAHTATYALHQPDLLFANGYTWTVTSQRGWPGFPAAGSVGPLAAGTATIQVPVAVPDSAAAGDNLLCFTLAQPNGVRLDSCCTRVTVQGVTGVAGAIPGGGLQLRGAWPNPASRRLSIAFSLAGGGAPATLELIDLAGRRVLAREVGGLGAGPHVLDLSHEAAALRPGMYSIRLRQGGRAVTEKVAIVR